MAKDPKDIPLKVINIPSKRYEQRADGLLSLIPQANNELSGDHARLESLKIAADIGLKINHFENQYESMEELFRDIDIIHAIADYNLKYIKGDK